MILHVQKKLHILPEVLNTMPTNDNAIFLVYTEEGFSDHFQWRQLQNKMAD